MALSGTVIFSLTRSKLMKSFASSFAMSLLYTHPGQKLYPGRPRLIKAD
jgi:hypothetical protein